MKIYNEVSKQVWKDTRGVLINGMDLCHDLTPIGNMTQLALRVKRFGDRRVGATITVKNNRYIRTK